MKSPKWTGPLVCEVFLPGGQVERLFSNAYQFVGKYYVGKLKKARGSFARRFEIHMMWLRKGGAQ